MYSTQVYYYTPRQTVVVFVGTSTRRYNTVYAKNLKLHKGVDNKIQFQFLNQEQKPVNITDKEILCRIISADGTTVLLQKLLTLQLPLTGLALLEVNASELLDIDAQLCGYSLEVPDGAFEYPVFVDSEAGGRGVIQIVNSILPPFIPSTNVTIPSHEEPVVVNYTNNNAPQMSTTSTLGNGAIFSITVNDGTYYTINGVTDGGQDYELGDEVTISGDVLDGSSPANDLTVAVTSVNGAGSIFEVEYVSGVPPTGSTVTFYSSVFGTYETDKTTIQSRYINYTGNVQIQGSVVQDSDWYDIGEALSFTGNTITHGNVVTGFHPYLRLKFVSTGGNVQSILTR